MQIIDTEGKIISREEYDNKNNDFQKKVTQEIEEDGLFLGMDRFILLNQLGLDIEIEFNENKKEVIKNVHLRSAEKSIESSSSNLNKVLEFEGRTIIK